MLAFDFSSVEVSITRYIAALKNKRYNEAQKIRKNLYDKGIKLKEVQDGIEWEPHNDEKIPFWGSFILHIKKIF